MIILDTHILIWWLGEPDKLSKRAEQEIEKAQAGGEILASTISIWEICMLVKERRLKFTMNLETWLEKVEELSFLKFIHVDNKIAVRSVLLNNKFHKDPADRIIVATAQVYGCRLITSDKKILRYKEVETIW